MYIYKMSNNRRYMYVYINKMYNDQFCVTIVAIGIVCFVNKINPPPYIPLALTVACPYFD